MAVPDPKTNQGIVALFEVIDAVALIAKKLDPEKTDVDDSLTLPDTVTDVFNVKVPVHPVELKVKQTPAVVDTGQEFALPESNITSSVAVGIAPAEAPPLLVVLQELVSFQAVPTLLK